MVCLNVTEKVQSLGKFAVVAEDGSFKGHFSLLISCAVVVVEIIKKQKFYFFQTLRLSLSLTAKPNPNHYNRDFKASNQCFSICCSHLLPSNMSLTVGPIVGSTAS